MSSIKYKCDEFTYNNVIGNNLVIEISVEKQLNGEKIHILFILLSKETQYIIPSGYCAGYIQLNKDTGFITTYLDNPDYVGREGLAVFELLNEKVNGDINEYMDSIKNDILPYVQLMFNKFLEVSENNTKIVEIYR